MKISKILHGKDAVWGWEVLVEINVQLESMQDFSYGYYQTKHFVSYLRRFFSFILFVKVPFKYIFFCFSFKGDNNVTW